MHSLIFVKISVKCFKKASSKYHIKGSIYSYVLYIYSYVLYIYSYVLYIFSAFQLNFMNFKPHMHNIFSQLYYMKRVLGDPQKEMFN